MIKGVSKQILEVTNPDNPYFEKIIFFVRAEHREADRARLRQEAEQVAATVQRPPKIRRSRSRLIGIALSGGAFAVVSCLLTLLVNFLLNR